jgi:hypothetical protein
LIGFSLLLPRTDYILLGMTASMICYAFLSLKYLQVRPERHEHRRNRAVTRGQP